MSGFMSSVVGVCGGLLAQAPAEDALGLMVLLRHLIAASVFALMGLAIFGLSVWVLNRCLPFSLRKELEEDQNVAVGLIVWFWEPPADRDSTHFGFALGLAGSAFFACGMLGRVLCPKPQAVCPQCGCDWDAESDNDSQAWRAWSGCPSCGLKMTEDSGKQLPPR
jgi:hypothetical protein